MKIIIIEDEKPAARRLKRMLNDMGMEVQTMLHSVEESIQWFLQNEHPDLILLDIQLSDGLSFEIFKEVSIESNIIFTTAYDEYALKAFKLNSIDYLLKPIDDDELRTAIDKYRKYSMRKNNLHFDLDEIKNLLVNPLDRDYKKRFTIKVGQHLKIVNMKSIECFYSDNKATFLYTEIGNNYILDDALEQIEEQLDPVKFFRVSRKFIVHMDFIKDIISYTNSRLQVKLEHFNEFDIIVSREKVKDFKNWLE